MKIMKHGSLFSGIGGFDLSADRAGWENEFHCEWNEFGQKVLKYYWPDAESFTDITKTDFTSYANKIDVLTGGFPCQPYSTAGKRLGKEDDRHLWPEMLRAIREIKPRWVVGENVRGLISWNGGVVFDEVQTDLETAFKEDSQTKSLEREGYEVFPFILPACGVNAPHQRYRVWFVAYNPNARLKSVQQKREHRIFGSQTITDSNSESRKQKIKQRRGMFGQERESVRCFSSSDGETQITPNTDDNGLLTSKVRQSMGTRNDSNAPGKKQAIESKRRPFQIGVVTNSESQQGEQLQSEQRKISEQKQGEFRGSNCKGDYFRVPDWNQFPTQSPVCNGNDGIQSKLDGITFSKWRNESIKAGGNAIVPQVAYQIFKAINEYEKIFNQ